jgi:hypothetical protein
LRIDGVMVTTCSFAIWFVQSLTPANGAHNIHIDSYHSRACEGLDAPFMRLLGALSSYTQPANQGECVYLRNVCWVLRDRRVIVTQAKARATPPS